MCFHPKERNSEHLLVRLHTHFTLDIHTGPPSYLHWTVTFISYLDFTFTRRTLNCVSGVRAKVTLRTSGSGFVHKSLLLFTQLLYNWIADTKHSHFVVHSKSRLPAFVSTRGRNTDNFSV